MAREFKDEDFADSGRTFSDSDFADEQPQAPSSVERQSTAAQMPIQQAQMFNPSDLAALGGPGLGDRLTKDLLTNDPAGFSDDMIRGIPAMTGAALMAPFGPAGMAAGGAAGESLRQAAVNAYSTYQGTEPTSPLGVIGRVGLEGAAQFAGGKAAPYLAEGFTSGAKAIGRGIGAFQEYTTKNLAGVSKQSYDFAKKNVETVAKYIGATPEQANALASKLRSSIEDAAKAGEKYYREVAEKIIGTEGGAGSKINVREALSDSVESIKKQFGYDAPVPPASSGHHGGGPKPLEILDEFGNVASRIKPEPPPIGDKVQRVMSPDEAAEFAKFTGLISKLKEATPKQVYYLQRDLNNAIMRFSDKPLGNALKQLRGSVRELIEKNADALPDLVEANRAYASSQELRETSQKLTNANDIVGEIRRIFGNEFATGKKAAIEEIAAKVPGVGATVNELRGFNAAASFDPLFRSLPQTGMGALGIGAGAGAVWNPLTMAVSAPFAAMASPRAQFMALRAGQAAGPAVNNAIQSAGAGIQGLAPTIGPLGDAYMRRRMANAP